MKLRLYDWRESQLWALLQRREDQLVEQCNAFLTIWMPAIQSTLQQAATSPPDFTLHDAQHSYRVAERMASLICPHLLEELSSPEATLLLLSAYLHDIGMTPMHSKLLAHREYLLGGATDTLSDSDVSLFRRWLADTREVIAVPTDGADRRSLSEVERLVALYCRHRHDEWGAEWIRQKAPAEPELYPSFLDDLTSLCQSHHWGEEELKSPTLNPKHVRPRLVVHLRFLACVLRVADVLDVDPERTPRVIFSHREIASGSHIYWWKDQELVIDVRESLSGEFPTVSSNQQVVLTARPSRAIYHKAVLDTAADIERELQLCAALNRTLPFNYSPVGETLPHCWSTAPSLITDVRERDNSYIYMDSAFRVTTDRMLDLLTGRKLYSTEMVAARELVQNAFDAIRMQLASEELLRDAGHPSHSTNERGALHRVSLEVSRREGRWWLICCDDGVGMTRHILRENFLTAGAAPSRDVNALKEACKRRGIDFTVTGTFGIGVLSYFMLADRVVVKTCRNSDIHLAGGPEQWIFETDGVGTFGELRRREGGKRGTEVALRLREGVVGDSVSEWAEKLGQYLWDSIDSVPCWFSADLPGENSIAWSPGWTKDEAWITEFMLRGSDRAVTRSTAERQKDSEKSEDSDSRVDASMELCREKLHVRVVDGELEHGLGDFRVLIPYFQADQGSSLIYAQKADSHRSAIKPILKDGDEKESLWLWSCAGRVLFSWKGIRLKGFDADEAINVLQGRAPKSDYCGQFATVLVNFVDEASGEPLVDRDAMRITEVGKAALETLNDRVLGEVHSLIDRECPEEWRALNFALLGQAAGKPERFHSRGRHWPSTDEGGVVTRTFIETTCPVVKSLPAPFNGRADITTLRGVKVAHTHQFPRKSNVYELSLDWCDQFFEGPTHIAVFEGEERSATTSHFAYSTNGRQFLDRFHCFELVNVCADGWNRRNLDSCLGFLNAFDEATKVKYKDADHVFVEEFSQVDPKEAATILRLLIEESIGVPADKTIWQRFVRKRQTGLIDLWNAAFVSRHPRPKCIYSLEERYGGSITVLEFSVDGIKALKGGYCVSVLKSIGATEPEYCYSFRAPRRTLGDRMRRRLADILSWSAKYVQGRP